MASGESSPALNAILIGGTGATGKCLLGSLLQAKVSSTKKVDKAINVAT